MQMASRFGVCTSLIHICIYTDTYLFTYIYIYICVSKKLDLYGLRRGERHAGVCADDVRAGHSSCSVASAALQGTGA